MEIKDMLSFEQRKSVVLHMFAKELLEIDNSLVINTLSGFFNEAEIDILLKDVQLSKRTYKAMMSCK